MKLGKIQQANLQFNCGLDKIGQQIGRAGNKFAQNCADFASQSQKIAQNTTFVDSTNAGKAIKKITNSDFAQEFTDGFVNTYKQLGALAINAGKAVVSIFKK